MLDCEIYGNVMDFIESYLTSEICQLLEGGGGC